MVVLAIHFLSILARRAGASHGQRGRGAKRDGDGPVRCQQHGRCVRLGPERDQSLSGEAEHITPASIKIVNSCAAHLRQNIPEEGEWNPFHKE